MSKTKLQAMVEELVSLRELAVELADEIDTLQDVIKADMQRQGVDTNRGRKAHRPLGCGQVQPVRFQSVPRRLSFHL